MEERRQYVRLSGEFKVAYSSLPKTGKIDATVKDVSAGGIRFVAKQPLAPGTRLRFQIGLPGERPIPFTGEVVSSDQYKVSTSLQPAASFEIGVRIVQIAPTDREALKRYISLNL